MRVISKPNEMQTNVESLRNEGKKIAVIPTMGYLHEGHTSLIRKGRELADIVITTLFVNPTQFGPNEDFEKYPRDFARDFQLAEEAGTDFLFNPVTEDIYQDGYNTLISISGITDKFEGASRQGHFDGVATIVAKIFNITKPHYAIFGQKDYQQTLVIKQLVRDFFFDLSVVVAPTVRESDGLALSSRNVYLSPDERTKAVILFKALDEAEIAIQKGENRRKILNAILHNAIRSIPEIKIDYACAADADTLEEPDVFLPGEHVILMIAVFNGITRLIDNALVTIPQDPQVKKHYFV
ncbi:MAG: pantoate--beta-alanine ligase [Ignavibacteria bacterium GWB2_35_12]|nr:MAG: pantoate--beta-alanine ligase [Ignavibacteria bacterium GWA2_35_8]OGU39385.1 MAG: pantoate--beta-alanine ligase [Ignavibacteria bacterium GWB2_35_12]OGU96795.1 MAG: pantoate--beta-alanine ligase [Ignavibacteria bacterium RIFOXYA2_FULL_35_10]OGV21087.1 MAG: pantoate--beta-alanine ligase [Ignavibacteria bacterium RIFOXYC2_FULL_35_21]